MGLKQQRYTDEQYSKMFMYAGMAENLQAMCEIDDHRKFFDRLVKVVKGRKVPIGTVGKVFWLSRRGYSYGRDWLTRIGIKDEDGNVHWTYAENVELAEKC